MGWDGRAQRGCGMWERRGERWEMSGGSSLGAEELTVGCSGRRPGTRRIGSEENGRNIEFNFVGETGRWSGVGAGRSGGTQ